MVTEPFGNGGKRQGARPNHARLTMVEAVTVGSERSPPRRSETLPLITCAASTRRDKVMPLVQTPNPKRQVKAEEPQMQTPIEIAFKHVDPSDEIKALVAEKAEHLEKFYDGITSCHVYIRAPHQSQRKGNLFEVTVEVRVPGQELLVRSNQNDVARHEHLEVALRDAFAAMAKEIKRWKAQVSGEVKTHDGPLQGKVVEIHHDNDYGQIIATDNRLIYFHRNSVVEGTFDDLRPRDAVELVVQTKESDIGPQASTVRPIGNLEFDPATKPSRR